MKSRGRRSNRTFFPREYCLVAFLILIRSSFRPPNVRWQRGFAYGSQQHFNRLIAFEPESARTSF